MNVSTSSSEIRHLLGMLLLLLLFALELRADSCPTVLSKDEWGGKKPTAITKVNVSVPYVLIHHTATAQCLTRAECQSQLVAIQREHMKRKWDDIGYNFLVDELGHVYEGRGWGVHGAHSPNYNGKSVGISLIGNFMKQKPNATAIELVKDLIDCGVAEGHISGNYKLLGHRQTRPTQCPGDEFYREIIHWPHWTPRP